MSATHTFSARIRYGGRQAAGMDPAAGDTRPQRHMSLLEFVRFAAQHSPGSQLTFPAQELLRMLEEELGVSSTEPAVAAASEPAPDISPATHDHSPRERVEAYIRAHGDEWRKENDWVDPEDGVCQPWNFSARELVKARREGLFATQVLTGSGIDDGAILIQASDLLRYLTIREAAMVPGAPKPAWWDRLISERLRKKAA